MPLTKIVSGAQTGIDRGALDAALAAGFPCGGWCPAGRRAEDGPIPSRYPVDELGSASYEARTRRNVADSDATLIVYRDEIEGGTALTMDYCRELAKPVLSVDLASVSIEDAATLTRDFLQRTDVGVLNVAGPRASKWPEGRALGERLLGLVLSGPSSIFRRA